MAKAQSPIAEKIRKHASKKGVTIILDYEDTSEEARQGATSSFDHRNKVLTIVVSDLIKKGEKELIFELIKKVHEDGELIWRTDRTDTLTSYIDYTKAGSDKNLLSFFQDKLSKDDFEALKMACFIRSESKKHHNVHEYKKDIRQTFGDRGANIANLCSAGYFEEEFMPLYKNNSPEVFKEFYELAVGKKARALFIHNMMTVVEIEDEFEKMVNKALIYHMADFRVHALGDANVKTLKAFFDNRIADEAERFKIRRVYETSYPSFATEYIITML